MARQIEKESGYYYDSHSTAEDLMGESAFHVAVIRYLAAVLDWLFDGQLCAIHEDLNIYQTANTYEYPLAPDIAVFKGMPYQWVPSWKVGMTGPAPDVVFEVASEATWVKDLTEKPKKYERLGVQEYFAYDPNEPTLPHSHSQRLFGWQLDRQWGIMRPMMPEARGELWSEQLQSWLVPNGVYLQLQDHAGRVRLTRAEAQARRARIEARQKESERQRAELEVKQREIEQQRADAETRRADEAARRAEAEARQNQILKEKLRALGIDPDQLS